MSRKFSFLVMALAVGVWIAYFSHYTKETTPARVTSKLDSSSSLIGGNFALTDHTGKAVTNATYNGQFRWVFFGFTHCPDICPNSLGVMTKTLELMGEDAKRITPIFITVDPERDTPKVMADYIKSFYPTFVGLTGSKEEIAKVQQVYRVYVSQSTGEEIPGKAPKEPVISHSAQMYFMDEKGRYLVHFNDVDTPEGMVKTMREYIHSAGK